MFFLEGGGAIYSIHLILNKCKESPFFKEELHLEMLDVEVQPR